MQKESGQVVVLVALLLAVIIGFAALSIDIGSEVAHGIKLQKTADAAALAGVMAAISSNWDRGTIGNQVGATVANNMTSSPPNININEPDVTVSLSEPHTFYLASVLGFKRMTLTRAATADTGYPLSGYAIDNLSQTQTLELGGNGVIDVNGNVHSNCGISFDPTSEKVNINGNVTLCGQITGTYSANKTIEEDSPTYLSYTYFLAKLQYEASLAGQCYTSCPMNPLQLPQDGSNVLSGPIYVNGPLIIKDDGSLNFQDAAIYASGGITINSNGQVSIGSVSNGTVSLALYSGNGININDNNGEVTINGLIYAPNGTVTFNNNGSFTVYGQIVAQSVDFAGSGTPKVNYMGIGSCFQYYPQIAYLIK